MRNLILGIVGGIILSIIFIDSVKLRNEFYKTSLTAGRQIIEWKEALFAELDNFRKVDPAPKKQTAKETPPAAGPAKTTTSP